MHHAASSPASARKRLVQTPCCRKLCRAAVAGMLNTMNRDVLVHGMERRNRQMTDKSPHNLRRSCAKLCHSGVGESEQIQFILGHVSVQTTERYLGCKQRIRGAVNDRIGIEP